MPLSERGKKKEYTIASVMCIGSKRSRRTYSVWELLAPNAKHTLITRILYCTSDDILNHGIVASAKLASEGGTVLSVYENDANDANVEPEHHYIELDDLDIAITPDVYEHTKQLPSCKSQKITTCAAGMTHAGKVRHGTPFPTTTFKTARVTACDPWYCDTRHASGDTLEPRDNDRVNYCATAKGSSAAHPRHVAPPPDSAQANTYIEILK